MSSVWNEIRKRCGPIALSEPFTDILVTRDDGDWHWLIGPHPELSKLATMLRTNEALCDELWERQIRFGFRTFGENPTDVPPLGRKRQERYGTMKKQKVADHSKERVNPIFKPVNELKNPTEKVEAAKWRKNDEFSNVQTYWASQTPQAHHIVEFNNLKRVGLSKEGGQDPLDYDKLPCVLLMAEFHQRYISAVLKQTHGMNGDKATLLGEFLKIYQSLYRFGTYGPANASPFKSFWDISEIVFGEAQKKFPAAKK